MGLKYRSAALHDLSQTLKDMGADLEKSVYQSVLHDPLCRSVGIERMGVNDAKAD